ncbi:MAG: hypothetical protein QHH10_13875 [Peptococcaceae bacterium]|jgi:predicted nucleotide-binding protein (sugar kinase/HSP70/actin superfamily)|nr:hypothetical protein [Peptococcaceae bacterium]MDH7526383.1 hypothetical protein [Peptococcaceae bacterium]
MRLSFPHIGKLHAALEKVCRLLGIPCLVPSLPGPRALELGQELAPEGSCLPFCLVLGNMREALELGADTLIMPGGSGPCRFGYFAYLAFQLLNEAGYRFAPLIIDRGHYYVNFRQIKKTGGVSTLALLKAIRFGWAVVACEDALDRLERECLPPETGAFLKTCRDRLKETSSLVEVAGIHQAALRFREKHLLTSRKEFLKVGLVGDIYTLLEPYANNRVEEYLREKGVVVIREMSISGWLPNIFLPWRRSRYRQNLLELASPYLRDAVGGFGLESVAKAKGMRARPVDGIIQLFPLGCMPEIVARSALDKLSREEDVPVLSVTLDQHKGMTGFETRLEAFLDVLAARKRKQLDSLSFDS